MDLVHKPWTGVWAVHGGLYGDADRRLAGAGWDSTSPHRYSSAVAREGKGEAANPFGASPRRGRR
jgi:hypothetical protein